MEAKDNLLITFLVDHTKDKLKGDIEDGLFEALINFLLSHLYSMIIVVGYDVVEEQSFSPEEWPFLKSGAADFYYITADYGTRTERIKVFLVQE